MTILLTKLNRGLIGNGYMLRLDLKFILSFLLVGALQCSSAAAGDAETEYKVATINFINNKNQDEAIAAFERIVEIAPKYIKPRSRLGELYYMRGDLDKAKVHYEAVIAIDPQAKEGLQATLMVGEINDLLKRYNTPAKKKHYLYMIRLTELELAVLEKKEKLSKLIELTEEYPTYHEAYIVLAHAYKSDASYDHAVATLEEGMSKAPADKSDDFKMLIEGVKRAGKYYTQEQEAIQLFKDGEYLQAGRAFEKAFGIDQGQYASLLSAANCYVQAGKYGEATKLYRLIRKNGDWENALFAEKQLRTVETMAKTLADEKAVDELIGGAAYLQSKAAFANNEVPRALQLVDRAINEIKLDPAYSKFYVLRGRLRLQSGLVNGAEEDFKEAISINRTDREARLELCSLYENNEQSAEAAACLNGMPEALHDHSSYLKLGILELQLENYSEAENALNNALSSAPDDNEREVISSWMVKVASAQGKKSLANKTVDSMNEARPSPLNTSLKASDKAVDAESKPSSKRVKVDFSILE